jgi:hypothetical protein
MKGSAGFTIRGDGGAMITVAADSNGVRLETYGSAGAALRTRDEVRALVAALEACVFLMPERQDLSPRWHTRGCADETCPGCPDESTACPGAPIPVPNPNAKKENPR